MNVTITPQVKSFRMIFSGMKGHPELGTVAKVRQIRTRGRGLCAGLVLLFALLLLAGCSQAGNETTNTGGARVMDKPVEFDMENTIAVLNDVLVDEDVTEESPVIWHMRDLGIRGATQARLIEEPGRVTLLEVVTEDGRKYEFDVAKGFSPFYHVNAVRDMQTGEFIWDVSTYHGAPS